MRHLLFVAVPTCLGKVAVSEASQRGDRAVHSVLRACPSMPRIEEWICSPLGAVRHAISSSALERVPRRTAALTRLSISRSRSRSQSFMFMS